ncbi:MAG: hypothetical protein IPG71_11300 [bacterium]|nr:hypothetical protein [bacterium]
MSLQIRQDGAHSGQYLMDRDRDELALAAECEWGPCLTIYEWEVPTLSLGFHQETTKLDLPRLAAANMPLVRRPTGGAAVLHSEELTYAIVVPTAGDLRAGAWLQEYVGISITEALCEIGVQAALDERGEALSPLPNRTSCFARTSRWEVAVKGKKLVGSAQRRQGDALLQHGSILMGNDHLRIVEYLAVNRPEERDLLRKRLDSKATCVTNEIGAGDHREILRAALESSFAKHYAEFTNRCATSKVSSVA